MATSRKTPEITVFSRDTEHNWQSDQQYQYEWQLLEAGALVIKRARVFNIKEYGDRSYGGWTFVKLFAHGEWSELDYDDGE